MTRDIDVFETAQKIATIKKEETDITPIDQESLLRQASKNLFILICGKPSTSINSSLKDALNVGERDNGSVAKQLRGRPPTVK